MNELAGGIKNALERGESIESIKRSFLNAGYNPQEVNEAMSEAGSQSYNPPTPVVTSNKPEPSYHPLPGVKPVRITKPRLKWIIIGVVCLLVLVGAGLVGLYWSKLGL